MSEILVTGGAGYVGSVCCARLLEAGHSVVVIDDLSTGHRQAVPPRASFHCMDVGDRAAVASLLAQRHIDVVFHFAAKALIPESVSNPGMFFDSNVASGIAFLETLRKAGIRKFVFSSSAAVYGLPRVVPIPEDQVREPVNSYGETKLMLERVLHWYAVSYGWSVVAFRYFNACGATASLGELHGPETHVLPLLLQTASGRRSSFEIYGADYPTPDGSCLRDFVHVLDIAEAHLLALRVLNGPGFCAYNIGTGISRSVKELCSVVEQVTGKKLNIRIGPPRPGDPPVLCASPQKLKAELGWAPRHSGLREIVLSAWEWEQQLLCHDPPLVSANAPLSS
jgi:UDP-glucose 4-epimerase